MQTPKESNFTRVRARTSVSEMYFPHERRVPHTRPGKYISDTEFGFGYIALKRCANVRETVSFSAGT